LADSFIVGIQHLAAAQRHTIFLASASVAFSQSDRDDGMA
jgi:hypothetical protein